MTECQGCGAWNDTSRTLCVLCGTPLAETDEWDAAAELPPLPPLPDGGLGASMPTWLREPPLSVGESLPSTDVAAPARMPDLAPLGPRADPRTFLSDDDFPRWLRDLAARRQETARHSSESSDTPAAWPDWPGWTASSPEPASMGIDSRNAALTVAEAAETAGHAAPAREPEPEPRPEPVSESAPEPDGRLPAAVVAARTLEERRGRDVWETLLLVLLCLGVIVAALWALVSNGVFSPSV